VTTTALQGRPALRLCTINPRTTEEDISGTLDRLATQVAAGHVRDIGGVEPPRS
jgi:hypothetical protein